MRLYFDTSAVVPLYVPEPASPRASERLRDATTLFVSWLTEVEFRSALALKTQAKALEPDSAKRVLKTFQRHIDQRVYELLSVDREVFAQAAAWLERFDTPLRSLDALHLACCQQAECVLVTLDEGLSRAARHLGVPCDFLGAE
ncbi:type II toxin-antitoxin system VapC family toxin [Deferrisoma camini]|uniref:type II toxin-antitoxin system VapC family toxin n=1 Tax=Deferrisoma camini TaxID=1035120 RepID=UPI00046D13AD|nr:type II toxin-antitoxin system VapC family toxin [Deferrisoma camini]